MPDTINPFEISTQFANFKKVYSSLFKGLRSSSSKKPKSIKMNFFDQGTMIDQDGTMTDIKCLVSKKIKFYQTADALETIAIIEDSDGSISIGIARAGRTDIENKLVTSEDGIKVAKGRAEKAKVLKVPLIKRNYLRGIHAMRIEG